MKKLQVIKKLLWVLCTCLLLTACAAGDVKTGSSSERSYPGEKAASVDAEAAGDFDIPVTLSGGSGRASLESPAHVRTENGGYILRLVWSSPNYDYMLVDGERFKPVNNGGNSVFEIPVASFDEPLSVTADTTAMGTPHEIDYVICFNGAAPQTEGESVKREDENVSGVLTEADLKLLPEKSGSLSLAYADQFSVDYYGKDYALITVKGTGQTLFVREGADAPGNWDEERVPVIKAPLKHIYLAASSAMDYFRVLDALDLVEMTSTAREDWSLPEIKEAMDSGELEYVGKYNTPDYERILSGGTDLAVESTMIFHNPETKEQLLRMGIPVLVEHTSYEAHPLGRVEWIKLYGLLAGKEEEAEAFFDAQVSFPGQLLNEGSAVKEDAPVTAFFYVTANGAVNVRKSGDYIVKMIELAGGKYFMSTSDGEEEENALSTINLQPEEFYAAALDADILIYSSTIDGGIESLDDLFGKSELFREFKAVKENGVYCTDKRLFQQSTAAAEQILEFNSVFSGSADENALSFLHPVR